MRVALFIFFTRMWLSRFPTMAKPARESALTTLRPDAKGRPSAADLHEGNERRETRIRQPCVPILKVEAYRLTQGGESLLHRRPLTGNIQLRAEGNVHLPFPRHHGGEPHGKPDKIRDAHPLKPFHRTPHPHAEHPTVTASRDTEDKHLEVETNRDETHYHLLPRGRHTHHTGKKRPDR